MECLNKNKVLAFYFTEGNENELNAIRSHINKCDTCQQYLSELKQTMCKLDKLEEQEPPQYLLNRIINETAVSAKNTAVTKTNTSVSSIVQIALGQIFIFLIIYIVNSSALINKIWESLKIYIPVKIFGSISITLIIIFGIGALVTLAAAPILLNDSKRNKSFSLK